MRRPQLHITIEKLWIRQIARYRTANTSGCHEHKGDHDLVHNRLRRVDTSKNQTRHHTREADNSHGFCRINRGTHTCSNCFSYDRNGGLVTRRSQSQPFQQPLALIMELAVQASVGQTNRNHRIAGNHTRNRYDLTGNKGNRFR